MVIVSWNLASRVKKFEAQASRLLGVGADILCLQETTRTTLPLWHERLREADCVAT